MTINISYKQLLQNRNFALLWTGRSISLIGDIFFMIAINWLILEKTDSALQVGGNLIVTAISRVFFSSLAGVLADRWNRRRLLLGSDILRGILVLSLSFTLWLFPFNIWYIYITNFLLTVLSSFFLPAYQAVLPNILEREALVAGRSLTTSSSNLFQALGSAFSGLLIAIFDVQLGIIFNGLSFFFSGLMIYFVSIQQSLPVTQKPLTIRSLFGDMFDGWKFIRNQAVLISIFILFTLGDFGAAFTWPVHVVFAEKILQGGPQLYGYLSSIALIGGFVGAIFVGRYSSVFNQRPGLSYIVASLAWGFLSILFGLTSSIPLALVYRFLIGWVLSMIHVPIAALLDANSQDSYRGRIWATIGIGSQVASTVSVGLSGLVSDHWSPRVSYLIAGILLLFTALVAWISPALRSAQIRDTKS